MSEKKQIKSWRSRHVRIKPEYVERTMVFQGYYTDDDDEVWVEDKSLPMVEDIRINCPLAGFVYDPEETFEVMADIYGIDLYKHTFTPFEVGSVEPTHQVILKGRVTGDPYIWDTKYFDVVRQERVWVKDEEF
jgi:hypothetical protein